MTLDVKQWHTKFEKCLNCEEFWVKIKYFSDLNSFLLDFSNWTGTSFKYKCVSATVFNNILVDSTIGEAQLTPLWHTLRLRFRVWDIATFRHNMAGYFLPKTEKRHKNL